MITSNKFILGLSFAALLSVSGTASAENKPVGIGSGDQMSADFMVNGEKMSIMRTQDNANVIDEKFVKTSRPCPPFCIQPAVLAPGVETIAELEVISYIQAMHNGEPVIVQDSRTEDWHARLARTRPYPRHR
jgi:hypothetical protein